VPRSNSSERPRRQTGARRKTGRRPGPAEPPPEHVVAVSEFTSPKTGRKYTVVETNETDAYEDERPPSTSRRKRGPKLVGG
jgi:hypothetical protein